jgi:hypothetical protein
LLGGVGFAMKPLRSTNSAWNGNKPVEKNYCRAIVTAARPPHMIIDNFITLTSEVGNDIGSCTS